MPKEETKPKREALYILVEPETKEQLNKLRKKGKPNEISQGRMIDKLVAGASK
jgi:hypothetical protein